MPSDRLGAALAAAALAAIGAPSPSLGHTVLWVPLCHGGYVPLSLPAKGDRDPAKPAPAGCHALCLGKRRGQRADGGMLEEA